MKTNHPASTLTPVTHEGGTATRQTPLLELTRAVSTCLLWEHTFYEKGSAIAQRMADLCDQVPLAEIARLAVRARTDLHLRHVPLWLVLQMARVNSAAKLKSPLVAQTLVAVCQRADELAELVALYWREGKKPLPAQIKKGLAMAFPKFSAFQLAKWNRDGVVKLRDVLFLARPHSTTPEQRDTWSHLANRSLATPDTWEVALSAGADKKATWERLLTEKHLGYMALLMNLRNMTDVGVTPALVETAVREGAATSQALPFRFLMAAKHAPQYAAALSDAFCSAVTDRLDGRTVVVVDVSGSMDEMISAKSTLRRWEAAGALAVLLREMTPACRVFTFSDALVEIPNYRGLPMVAAIGGSQAHANTQLAAALAALKSVVPDIDRLVVVTDEQSADGILACWAPYGYVINVAPYQPGLDTSNGWHRISGWSDRVVDWMRLEETAEPLGRDSESSSSVASSG